MHPRESAAAPAAAGAFDLATFMRGLAHEIANPLNAITMNTELMRLLLDRGDSARAREVLDRLLGDCARCARMVRELQKFGSGLREQAQARVPVRALLDGAANALALEYSGTLPAFRIDSVDAQLSVDRTALERALTALLRNAAEAGAGTVAITARRDGDALVIDVRDDGAGPTPEDLAHAGEPFYTTRRASGGLGLGLTLARELLRWHGGALQLAANAPRGMHVQVRLPERAAP